MFIPASNNPADAWEQVVEARFKSAWDSTEHTARFNCAAHPVRNRAGPRPRRAQPVAKRCSCGRCASRVPRARGVHGLEFRGRGSSGAVRSHRFVVCRGAPARRLRGLASSSAGSLRGFADRHGVGTGGFGRALYRQRILVRVVIALGAAALIIAVRPLSGALIVWTLIGAMILIAALELLQRPTSPEPASLAT
jgi:hypothetical protein